MNKDKPQPDFMGMFHDFHARLKTPEFSFAEWDDQFGALHNEVLNLDSPVVRATDCHFVWTECSDDEGGWIALPGFETVNRSGYWLSEQPWQDGDQVVVRIAHPSGDEEAEEEGRPWSEHLRSQARKRLRDLVLAVLAANATSYIGCGVDPRDAENFRSELMRTVDEIAKMFACLHSPDEPGQPLARKSK
jgi:hypothetical protein